MVNLQYPIEIKKFITTEQYIREYAKFYFDIDNGPTSLYLRIGDNETGHNYRFSLSLSQRDVALMFDKSREELVTYVLQRHHLLF